jgi:hypothetical protein
MSKNIGQSIEALADAWGHLMSEVGFPLDYDGTATPDVHRAAFLIENEIIRNHIVASGDMRLFSLMHLLGQASLRMEQVLWPEEYKRIENEIEKAIQEANDPNTVFVSHEVVEKEIAAERKKLQAKIDADAKLTK